MDFVAPRRPVSLSLVAGRGHYETVIEAVLAAHTSVWIATANLKELMVEDHLARPGARRRMGKTRYRSVLAAFAELAARGVELRILHADRPSRPFRAEVERHAELERGLERRICPRVHLKTVIVDGELMYLGSANWTGAGLGARGTARRNFELGVVTDDGPMIDQVQAMYERIWSGGGCAGCGLRAVCPAPLDRAPVEKVPARKSAKPRAKSRVRAPARPRPKRKSAKSTATT